jgi:GT2 family glycosyltransferase
MSEPRVGILLLNWNGWRDTLECLDSLTELKYANRDFIICDNASSDESVNRIIAWAASHGLAQVQLSKSEAEAAVPVDVGVRFVLIQNGENLGFAGGNNVGLRYILGRPEFDHVWILNNDVIVDPDCLGALVSTASRNPRAGGVGATIFDYSRPEVVQAAAGGSFSAMCICPRLRTAKPAEGSDPSVEFLSGASMLCPTEVLRRVGLIDEGFFIYCEDVDLSVRIRRAGYTLRHAPAARLWHKGGSTFGHRSERHDYYTVRNTFALVRRYYWPMLPVLAAYLTYRAVAPKIVRRQWNRLRAAWRGYIDYRRGVSGPIPT